MVKHNSFKRNCIKKVWWIIVWCTLETLVQRSSTSTVNCCLPTSILEQISSDAVEQGRGWRIRTVTSTYSKDWRLGCDSERKPAVEWRMAPVAGVETAWGSFKLFTSTRHIKECWPFNLEHSICNSQAVISQLCLSIKTLFDININLTSLV